LKSTGKLNDVIIPYKKVEKVRDIFDYIDEFAAVIVKPEVGSFARGVHYISKTNDNHFFVAEREKEQKYTEIELRKYFNELMEINANYPRISYFEFDLARQAIPNAIFLAKQESNEKFEDKNQPV